MPEGQDKFLFLDKDIQPQYVRDGGFVDVVDAGDLAAELHEKVPKGWVVKEYKYGVYHPDWSMLFGGDPKADLPLTQLILRDVRRWYENKLVTDIKKQSEGNPDPNIISTPSVSEIFDIIMDGKSPEDITKLGLEDGDNVLAQITATLEEYSLLRIAQKLQVRQEELQQIFEDENILIGSHFIIGNGEEEPRVYELQPKVADHIVFNYTTVRLFHNYVLGDLGKVYTPDSAREKVVQALVQELKNKFPSQDLRVIQDKLQKVVAKGESIFSATQSIHWDLFWPQNMLISKDGPKIVDTNNRIFCKDPNHLSNEQLSQLDVESRSLLVWQRVAEEIMR